MATEFTMHPLIDAEAGDDQLGVLPIYDYTDFTFDLVVTRRSGTSPTLDVVIEDAPLDDDEEYQILTSFSQVDGNTSLPDEQTKEGGGTDYTMPAGARFVRVNQTIGGTNPEWHYLVTATVDLFDENVSNHTALLAPRFRTSNDLIDYADQAEDDVVSRWLVEPTEHMSRRPWPTVSTRNLSDSADDRLALNVREDTGLRIREAIARRIEWLIRRDELEKSSKSQDGPLLRQHVASEWKQVDDTLRRHDSREPLYMI